MKNMTIDDARFMMGIHCGGKTRRDGSPVTDHYERVMECCGSTSRDVLLAAYLHDSLEDGLKEYELRLAGASDETIRLVKILTRRRWEPYFWYIRRICRNEKTMHIKLADLHNNTDAYTHRWQRWVQYPLAKWWIRRKLLDIYAREDAPPRPFRVRRLAAVLALVLFAGCAPVESETTETRQNGEEPTREASAVAVYAECERYATDRMPESCRNAGYGMPKTAE